METGNVLRTRIKLSYPVLLLAALSSQPVPDSVPCAPTVPYL